MKFDIRSFIYDLVRDSISETYVQNIVAELAEEAIDNIDLDTAIAEAIDIDRLVDEAVDAVLAEVLDA